MHHYSPTRSGGGADPYCPCDAQFHLFSFPAAFLGDRTGRCTSELLA